MQLIELEIAVFPNASWLGAGTSSIALVVLIGLLIYALVVEPWCMC